MQQLETLAKRCRPRVQMTAKDYAGAVEESIEMFTREAGLLINDHSKSPMLETIRCWSYGGNTPDKLSATAADTGEATVAAPVTAVDEAGACSALTAGIQDITSTLVNGCSLNDVLRMVLETMYRGIGFDRVLLALREPRGSRFSGRFGFGNDSENVTKVFAFELRDQSDVFQLAAGKCLDLVIADSTVENIRPRIPEWHRSRVGARSFILLPLAIEKRCIGLLYGDRLQANSLAIGTPTMGLLKTLRDQAVLAFRQR
jgi:transcriptional regulator with GAF, ATPase, and Fis domain